MQPSWDTVNQIREVKRMKRSLALMLSLFFAAGTAMVWADSTSPAKTVKTVKHHKKGKGSKKVTLNPQPLPPDKIPVNGSSTGPGGSTTGPGNTHQ
jgi:hypothetical protein